MARVQIADVGSGQDDDSLEAMFSPFFTTKRNGMGMGLSISRSIVEAHGGHLTAMANAPEPGLTFTFDLPPIASGSAQ
jgi:signal transduction histidine kinase